MRFRWILAFVLITSDVAIVLKGVNAAWDEKKAMETPYRSVAEQLLEGLKVISQQHSKVRSAFDIMEPDLPEDCIVRKALDGAKQIEVGGVVYDSIPPDPDETVPKLSYVSEKNFVRINIISLPQEDKKVKLVVWVWAHFPEPRKK